MSALTLELRSEPNQRLDLSPLTPARLAGMKPADIQAIAIGTAREVVTVGDLFSDAANERLPETAPLAPTTAAPSPQ